MSELKQMYDNLEKQIMTDYEVDDIVMAAISVAKVFCHDTSIKDIVERIKKKATEVKANNKENKFDTNAVDAISNTAELRNALRIYDSRPTLNPNTVTSLAHKLLDLSKNSDSKPIEIFDIAHNLSHYKEARDDSINGKMFRDYVVDACLYASIRETPNSVMASRLLYDLEGLSQDQPFPADYFGILLPLDDKKTAEVFLECTERALQQAEAKEGVNLGAGLIDSYTEIVQHHPEMAKKCNELVNKTANLQTDNELKADTYDLAYKYYEEVKKMDGVSDYDKSMARTRSASWERKAWQAKQEKEQSQHQTQQKTKEPDFKQMNFGDFEIEM